MTLVYQKDGITWHPVPAETPDAPYFGWALRDVPAQETPLILGRDDQGRPILCDLDGTPITSHEPPCDAPILVGGRS